MMSGYNIDSESMRDEIELIKLAPLNICTKLNI
jgi:hypothetical protein